MTLLCSFLAQTQPSCYKNLTQEAKFASSLSTRRDFLLNLHPFHGKWKKILLCLCVVEANSNRPHSAVSTGKLELGRTVRHDIHLERSIILLS